MIPLEVLRSELRLGNVTKDDSLLLRYEAAAVRYFERETGRYYGPPIEFTHTLDVSGWLPEEPHETPALVITDDNGTTVTGWTLTGRQLTDLGYYAAPLTVTYTAGYAPGDEPADVADGVLMLVQHRYTARTRGETLGTLPREINEALQRIIHANKRPAA